jgi:hypothetical protein
MRIACSWVPVVLAVAAAACAQIDVLPEGNGGSDGDADGDGDTDADGDGDGDGDSDADGDTDADADSDSDTDPATCDDTDDCGGAPCADGFCCASPCDGDCESCGLEGSEGSCTAVAAGADPDSDCASQESETCGTTGSCDGQGACALFGTETLCDDGEVCTVDDACDGAGGCAGVPPSICEPGPANECCEAGCSSTEGCLTTAGECPETCGGSGLLVGASCAGCGAANAEGTCEGGTLHACTDAEHSACAELACGGEDHLCTNAGGVWQWRTEPACVDGDPCTSGDACADGSCEGTPYTCTSEACLTRACDGLGGCAETPQPDTEACGTEACPADACAGLTWNDFGATCTSFCSGSGSCEACSCAPAQTACTAGGCCEAACDPAAGCATNPGSCGGVETCGANSITVSLVCTGCGPAGATGSCGGGGTFVCDGTTHTLCQEVSCGGQTWRCTGAGGVWQWRTSAECDDSDLCTWGDTCGGGTCNGTAIGCASTDCLQRACNGTSMCTEAPLPDTTPCGTTACNADYCSSNTFYDYPASCARYCNGGGSCGTCSCTTTAAACQVGGSNQCCTASCSAVSGCSTQAGSCADSCATNGLAVSRTCSGCGANLADGSCGGGTTYTCDAGTHTLCQGVSCSSATYLCTNDGGTWQWRTGNACDDSNACTTGTYCSGGACTGGSAVNLCWDGICNCGETSTTCPGDCGTSTGDCCTVHANPGCTVPAIQNCVCGYDYFCCNTAWDSYCVSEVESYGCGTCSGGGPGDCCTAHSTPGCTNGSIQSCVCAGDPDCCATQWDSVCVSEVSSFGCGAC